ncbi:hypothetical protein [uncultured Ruminococcus sp.]|uniref:hypothetical protein n=1 Tax=uncultured Ruminococcus sp. TaxID=165186 RepID=UPI002666D602|nr:hypothetical protein [uncultured Ruminococcus sp.]
MSGILDWMDELVEKFWDKICDFMPGDPFTDLILQLKHGSLSVYLGYINYFFPVGFLIKALAAFLSSLAVYYSVSVVLRWIRAVD